jgi:hypothetical protein
LTASLPRNVIISAQQQWLPNLAAEMTNGPSPSDPEQAGWSTAIEAAESAPPAEPSDSDTSQPASSLPAEINKPSIAKRDPPVCVASVLGQCLLFKARSDEAEAAKAETARPGGAAEAIDTKDAAPDGAEAEDASSEADAIASVDALADHDNVAATSDAETAAEPDGTVKKIDTLNVDGGKEMLSADEHPPQKTADQTDDLLFPTEAERRTIEAHLKRAEEVGQPKGTAGNVTDFVAAEPQPKAALVVGIDSDVDSESWAEYGGWYRQDYAILYRPTGHKDKFIYSWLLLTGPRAPKGDSSPAAAVFELLTGKDAQGSCTKCHSVDDLQRKRRVVNFSPASVEIKQGRFTNFIHQPHFQAVGIGQRIGILENRGCLTCHILEKGRSYLKSYEQGNPQNFVSNFGAVKKELCQTCHTSSTARQDCLLCHEYHVNGVNTPTMTTKISTPPQDKEPKGHRATSAPAPEGP